MLMIAPIENWLDYPGFEVWRFVNLFLFIGTALYLHRRFGRPIGAALRTRAAKIKFELENARKRKELAEEALKEVEFRLSQVDSKVAEILADAKAEAFAEEGRIRRSTDIEVLRLRAQAEKEIAKIIKSAQLDLRRFVAAQGIKEAEALIRRDLDGREDAALVALCADEFGGIQR